MILLFSVHKMVPREGGAGGSKKDVIVLLETGSCSVQESISRLMHRRCTAECAHRFAGSTVDESNAQFQRWSGGLREREERRGGGGTKDQQKNLTPPKSE